MMTHILPTHTTADARASIQYHPLTPPRPSTMIGINGLSNIARMPRISRPANKKKSGTAALHRMLLTILLCLVGWGEAWAYGENTSYVLEDLTERKFASPNKTGNYTINGPAHTLTFEAKRTKILGISSNNGNFYAQYSTDNGRKWTDVQEIDLPNIAKWYNFSCIIPENTTHIRFIEKAGGGGYKQVQNVRVTRATNITATTTSIDFGTRTINDASIAKTASFKSFHCLPEEAYAIL